MANKTIYLSTDGDVRKNQQIPESYSITDPIEFKRGDNTVVLVGFLNSLANLSSTGPGSTALEAAATKVIIGLKEKGKYDTDEFIASGEVTGINSDGYFEISLDLNTSALDTLLAVDADDTNDVVSVELMLEVSWSVSGGSQFATDWVSSKTIYAIIHNDVIRNNETTPDQSVEEVTQATNIYTFDDVPDVGAIGVTIGGSFSYLYNTPPTTPEEAAVLVRDAINVDAGNAGGTAELIGTRQVKFIATAIGAAGNGIACGSTSDNGGWAYSETVGGSSGKVLRAVPQTFTESEKITIYDNLGLGSVLTDPQIRDAGLMSLASITFGASATDGDTDVLYNGMVRRIRSNGASSVDEGHMLVMDVAFGCGYKFQKPDLQDFGFFMEVGIVKLPEVNGLIRFSGGGDPSEPMPDDGSVSGFIFEIACPSSANEYEMRLGVAAGGAITWSATENVEYDTDNDVQAVLRLWSSTDGSTMNALYTGKDRLDPSVSFSQGGLPTASDLQLTTGASVQISGHVSSGSTKVLCGEFTFVRIQ